MFSTFVIKYFAILSISIIKAQNITVYPADSFVDSIGVNTHWASANVYLNNYTDVKAKLAESGIRYIRDGTFNKVFVRVNDLYDSLGVKTVMITGRWKNGPMPQPLDPTLINDELNHFKNVTMDAILALEAPNEYDGSHGSDPDWVGTIRNYTMGVYSRVKTDKMFKNIPMLGPSLIDLKAYEAVGSLDPYIDLGNQHMYQWTYWPGFNGSDASGTRSISWFLDKLSPLQSPSGKPVHATETGYTNFLDLVGLSEEADGKYMPRIFAEFFRRGVARTYKYEFVDEAIPGREGLFGLLRNDLSEKPAFRAMRSLIQLFSDKGPPFQPTVLNYTLTRTTDNVRQLLFQKRNGDFYLMVWVEVCSWDVKNKIDLYPPSQQVVVTLQEHSDISNATLYAFNNTGHLNIINLPIINNQITFNATDKINFIKLNNGSSTSIPFGVYQFLPKNALHSSLDSNGERNSIPVIKPQRWSNVNQHWIVKSEGDNGFYRIMNRKTNQVLETNKGIVRLNNWLGLDSQKWKIDLLPNGFYQLTSESGSNQWTIDNQQWKLDWITGNI